MSPPAEPEKRNYPAKRLKANSACRACRARKLACDGERPCSRCKQDKKGCDDDEGSFRSPLTRRRMTELEDLIELHASIWHAAFPNFPLEQAAARSVSATPKEIAQEAFRSAGLHQPSPAPVVDALMPSLPSEETFSSLPDAPVMSHQSFAPPEPSMLPPEFTAPLMTQSHVQLQPVNAAVDRQPPHIRPMSQIRSTNNATEKNYPPTRPASPTDPPFLQNVYEFQSAAQSTVNTWSEQHALQTGNTPPSHLDGMGATVLDTTMEMNAGAGYIGMSSGAMLILVLRRLLNRDSLLSPLNGYSLHTLKPTSHAQVSNISNYLPGSGVRRVPTSTSPLSTSARMPRYREFRPLVDSYFEYFHAIIPIVHEPTIRAQLTGALPLPTSGGSRVLIFMIFAMGEFDLAQIEDDDNGYRYYEVARQAYQPEMMEEGSIQLVQGLAIMAHYLQRNNKPNSGYVCLGTAIRMAVALGIHSSNAHHPKSNPLAEEIRTRLWWGLVALEAGCSTTFGRPHGFGHASYLVARLPVNCDDDDLTVTDTVLPEDADHVALYTALLMQTKLAKKMLQLQDRISRSLPYPTVEQIKWCGQSFLADVRSYPAYMQPGTPGPFRLARAIQNWRARDYASILFRPVLLSAAWNSSGPHNAGADLTEIIDECRSLATETLQELHAFGGPGRDPHRGSQWYLLFYEVQSSLTLLLSAVWEPQHPSAEEWRTAVSQSIQRIREMPSVAKMGLSYAQTMENILQAQSTLGSTDGFINMRTQEQTQPYTDPNGIDWNQILLEMLATQNMSQDDFQGDNMLPFSQN
ncbi:hypothetical protein V866_001091 [Kwoniella sp. B9012]|uniref:Zn(2)-C6 fungal-type domain-containing protein n=1 Tax=Kwoniella europaea PYCC6329 TaxID=1423913 RepID=A0AAX4K9J6_9TREE